MSGAKIVEAARSRFCFMLRNVKQPWEPQMARHMSIMKNYAADPEKRKGIRGEKGDSRNHPQLSDNFPQNNTSRNHGSAGSANNSNVSKHPRNAGKDGDNNELKQFVDGHTQPTSIQDILDEVEDRGQLRDEVIQAIGETPEWKAYDQEVGFEIEQLKARYHASEETMTPSRRSQMSAHVKQVHDSIMEQHAEKIALEFVEGLSEVDKARLQEQFNRIDSKGVDLEYSLPEAPIDLNESLKMFSDSLRQLHTRMDDTYGPDPNATNNWSNDDNTKADNTKDHTETSNTRDKSSEKSSNKPSNNTAKTSTNTPDGTDLEQELHQFMTEEAINTESDDISSPYLEHLRQLRGKNTDTTKLNDHQSDTDLSDDSFIRQYTAQQEKQTLHTQQTRSSETHTPQSVLKDTTRTANASDTGAGNRRIPPRFGSANTRVQAARLEAAARHEAKKGTNKQLRKNRSKTSRPGFGAY